MISPSMLDDHNAFVIEIAWEHQTTDPALAWLLFALSDSLALGEGEGTAGSLPGPGPFHCSLPSTTTTKDFPRQSPWYYHCLTWLYIF